MSGQRTVDDQEDAVINTKRSSASAPDVVLCASDGEKVYCHKYLLANESPYFFAMFNSSFIEKDQHNIIIQVCSLINFQRLSIF